MATPKASQTKTSQTALNILFLIGFVHLLNDSISAVIPAMFPILHQTLGLTFTELGLIAFAANMTSSVMQPVVGRYTDKKSFPYALPLGMCATLLGMFGLALAPGFTVILLAVIFVGFGSAVFHPEGSRIAYLASGGRRGFAQSVYQVGGNVGQATAPLITAFVLVPLGQIGALYFTAFAALAVVLLLYVARWSAFLQRQIKHNRPNNDSIKQSTRNSRSKKTIVFAMILLVLIVFARAWYRAAITNFYTFYSIEQFGVTISGAQLYLFIFLGAAALGTFAGGPLSDRFGKKNIILGSMAISAPFAIALPFAGSLASVVLLAIIGFVLLTNVSVSVVYAQHLIPGQIGTASGLIVGFAFGMGAIGAVAIGSLADLIGLHTTITFASFLPLIGLLAFWLPDDSDLEKLT